MPSAANKGRPTASQVKIIWDSTVNPSYRKVAKIMTDAGFEISYGTVARYKEENWGVKTLDKVVAKATTALARTIPDIKPDSTSTEVVVASQQSTRMRDLLTRSVAENQATLQNTGLIASILIAEAVVDNIDKLMLEAPGDVARLLSAITEASQVRHVGGAGQTPAADDPNVIDVTPNKVNETSEALARFRKNAGLE